MSKNFENLDAWKEAKALAKYVYFLTSKFPKSELFGLVSQSNRAAVSIPANIAEGCSRSSNKEFVRFLEIATGSAYELETLMIIAFDQGHICQRDLTSFQEKISKVLQIVTGLKRKLLNSLNDKRPTANEL